MVNDVIIYNTDDGQAAVELHCLLAMTKWAYERMLV